MNHETKQVIAQVITRAKSGVRLSTEERAILIRAMERTVGFSWFFRALRTV